MSEPVSSDEIEDVLSSIRRLVSENAGAIRRGQDDDASPEKLVLTPAFRIDDDKGGDTPDEAAAHDGQTADATEVQDGEAADSSEVVGFSSARAQAAPEPEPEPTGADAVEAAVEDAAPVAADSDLDPGAVEAAEPADEVAPDAHDDSAADTGTVQTALERRIAELEAIIARSASDFEPDGSETADMADPDPVTFRHHPDEAPSEAAAAEADDGWDADDLGAEAWAEPDASDEGDDQVYSFAAAPDLELDDSADVTDSTDEAAPEAFAPEARAPWVEANPARNKPAPEPAELDDDMAAEPIEAIQPEADEWEDVAAADAADDPADDEGEDDATTLEAYAETDADEDEAVLDEEALREMVARMVREELQGSVGERITHNVRRMVRREIARALTLQSFD